LKVASATRWQGQTSGQHELFAESCGHVSLASVRVTGDLRNPALASNDFAAAMARVESALRE